MTDRPRRRTAAWAGAALAGLVLAGGLTTAAAQLSNQRVGLSSEPLTAGEQLAPPARTAAPPTRTATPRPARTATPTPARTAAPTVDDHGGDDSGRGRGRDHAEDD